MTDDLSRRVERLEARVERLEDRLDEHDHQESSQRVTASTDRLDQYDQHVMQAVDDVAAANPLLLRHEYEAAGVLDEDKQKQRAKRLKRIAAEEA